MLQIFRYNQSRTIKKRKIMQARVQIGGAGGAPSNNFIRSLRESGRGDYLIGTSCVPSDLFLADVDEKHVVPPANAPTYKERFLSLLKKTRPDFLHLQNDYEILAVSRFRKEVEGLGIKLFMPDPETIENCVDKWKSYDIWSRAGIKVARTIQLQSPSDLRAAFDSLGKSIWVRATTGGGGRGALPTDNYEFAKLWIDRFHGWGEFTASEMLTPRTVTWLSIWANGELVVGQTRRRRSWSFGNRTLSGVTGVTGVAETCTEPVVDEIAMRAISTIDKRPHGIFGVDMTYDSQGTPNPTEINVARFFTTHYFFTKCGLNMPLIYRDIALEGKFPDLPKKLNPLQDGLVWIRGMDVQPVATTVEELEKLETCLT
jgi:hypothetical protein